MMNNHQVSLFMGLIESWLRIFNKKKNESGVWIYEDLATELNKTLNEAMKLGYGPIYEAVAYYKDENYESECWGFYRGPKDRILEKFKEHIDAGWTIRLDEIEIKEIT